MTRPSIDLATVIAEAIQDHANHYRRGEPDSREVIEALGETGFTFLAGVNDPAARASIAAIYFNRLLAGAEHRPKRKVAAG